MSNFCSPQLVHCSTAAFPVCRCNNVDSVNAAAEEGGGGADGAAAAMEDEKDGVTTTAPAVDEKLGDIADEEENGVAFWSLSPPLPLSQPNAKPTG